MVKPSLLVLVPLLALTVSAQPRVPTITRSVEDLAEVLPPQEEESISTELVRLRERTEAQMAVVLVETTSDEPIEDFARRIFDGWKGGSRERNDGLLLVVAVKDRRVRLEVGYGLEGPIPDSVARALLEAQSPWFARGDWRGGILNIVEGVQERLVEANTSPTTTHHRSGVAAKRPRRPPATKDVFFTVLIFAAASSLVMFGIWRDMKESRGTIPWFLAIEVAVVATSAFTRGISIVETLGFFGAFVAYFCTMYRWLNSHPPSAMLVANGTPLLSYFHASGDLERAPTLWACLLTPSLVTTLLLALGLRYTLGSILNAMDIHGLARPKPFSLSLRAMIWLGYNPEYLREHQSRLDSAPGTDDICDSGGSLGGGGGGWGGGGWGGGGWSDGGGGGGGGDGGGGGGSSSF
ncbi:TPM domain-containing protein [Myxococcus sp. K38C18041901]|uniref:TPM domain-containing protein n=1 Tax=Myxococcus guangdongensis TaxID=2906760 RepID=UPI0020A702CA|nr:TPM domain-containing protein [Myxococcus guangdongensis]MCP3065145.1 TPM domain-containing protein [Myxococcus guangdongensis]